MELLWFELNGPITTKNLRLVVSQVYRNHFGFKVEVVDSMISEFQP